MAKISNLAPIKKYNECYPKFRDNTRFLEFKNLFANAIKIDGLDFSTETFVKNQLIDVGQVGFDKLTNRWSAVYGTGINELDNPTDLFFVMPNRASYYRKAYYGPSEDGAYLIKAMPYPYSIAQMIQQSVAIMDECDKSIMQNLQANRTPFYFIVNNDDTQLSIKQAIEEQQQGKPVVVLNKIVGDSIKGIATNPQWIVDKIATFENQVCDKLMNKIGTMTANINKRERVQVGEVNATVGQCVDYVYIMIDTFNEQCKTYGLPLTMRLNNALEEYYGTGENFENITNTEENK